MLADSLLNPLSGAGFGKSIIGGGLLSDRASIRSAGDSNLDIDNSPYVAQCLRIVHANGFNDTGTFNSSGSSFR
jgi:hypothetical protein